MRPHCVRLDHFQAALDLAAHAARLTHCTLQYRHVHAEANGAFRALLGRLLATPSAPGKYQSLSSRGQLPAANTCVFEPRGIPHGLSRGAQHGVTSAESGSTEEFGAVYEKIHRHAVLGRAWLASRSKLQSPSNDYPYVPS